MARVLLVEDEITVLILAESVVQGLGHSTYSAGSVVQALALLDDPGEIDLLFTDIRLPEGDLGGFEVAEQARRKNPNLKVLYTTGGHHYRRDEGDVRRGRRDAPQAVYRARAGSRDCAPTSGRVAPDFWNTRHKRKAPNRCAWLGARSAFFSRARREGSRRERTTSSARRGALPM